MQQAVNRSSSDELTRGALRRCARLGFESINIDLIYGLPRQTGSRSRRTVDAVVDAAARPRGGVLVRARAVDARAQKAIDVDELPPAERKLELFGRAVDAFLAPATGDRHGSLRAARRRARARARRPARCTATSWATRRGRRPTWWRSACRPSATSPAPSCRTPRSCADVLRGESTPGDSRRARLRARRDDRLRRYVITELMCNFRVDPDALEARFGMASMTIRRRTPASSSRDRWPIGLIERPSRASGCTVRAAAGADITMIFDRACARARRRHQLLYEDDVTAPSCRGASDVRRVQPRYAADSRTWRLVHAKEHDDVSGGDCGRGYRGTLDCVRVRVRRRATSR